MARVKIDFSIDTLAEGAGKELIERELSDIFNNINDPNADPTKKRSLSSKQILFQMQTMTKLKRQLMFLVNQLQQHQLQPRS